MIKHGKDLEEMAIGMGPGALWVVAGTRKSRVSSGIVAWSYLQCAKGENVAFCSFDQVPYKVQDNIYKLHDLVTIDEQGWSFEEVAEDFEKTCGGFHVFFPAHVEDNITLLEEFENVIEKTKATVFVVDSERLAGGDIIGDLKRLAIHMEVKVAVVTQLKDDVKFDRSFSSLNFLSPEVAYTADLITASKPHKKDQSKITTLRLKNRYGPL